jgi:hypothetical protein
MIINLMIYRDEHGCLKVSPSNVHANAGDTLCFRAPRKTSKMPFGLDNPARVAVPDWNVEIVVTPGDRNGSSQVLPDEDLWGVFAYSITSNGDCARGNSDPKIIIPR